MELLDAVRQWEVCMNQPTRIYGCLFEDCPLNEEVIFETGNSVEGVSTFRTTGCALMSRIGNLLRTDLTKEERATGRKVTFHKID